MKEHLITVTRVKSACGTPGHTDALLKCTCGWGTTLRHCEPGSREAQQSILYHRVTSLEKEVGIKFEVDYKQGVS